MSLKLVHPDHHDDGRPVWPETDGNGLPRSKSQENTAEFLRRVGVTLYHDAFARRSMIERAGTVAPISDDVMRELYFEADRLGLRPTREWFEECLLNIAFHDKRNEVLREFARLESEWDGKPRLDGWLVTYGRGRDTPYDRAAAKIMVVAMVRRARRPGVKFDAIPTLEGPQGGGKSSALHILAGGDAYFTDSLPIGASDKETIEATAGKLIAENGELAGMSKKEVSAIKLFASRQADRARLSYGRHNVEVPRSFIVVGTTNDNEYLRDATGNRRFWPLKVGTFDLDRLREDRGQLIGEAAHLESQGHPINLPPELWADAAREQSERLLIDPWQEAIASQLASHEGRTVRVRSGCILSAVGVGVDRRDANMQRRVATLMRALGFVPALIGKDRNRGWERKGSDDAAVILHSPAVTAILSRQI